MKKVRVEVQTSLTYTPFENIKELIKQTGRKEDKNGNDQHTTSNR